MDRHPFSLPAKLQQAAFDGYRIAVAAYSYMSLVPIIQPPIMKLLTTKKEREIKMEQVTSGIQTGENPLPNYRYGYCMSDSSKYCTTCWYAYAW